MRRLTHLQVDTLDRALRGTLARTADTARTIAALLRRGLLRWSDECRAYQATPAGLAALDALPRPLPRPLRLLLLAAVERHGPRHTAASLGIGQDTLRRALDPRCGVSVSVREKITKSLLDRRRNLA